MVKDKYHVDILVIGAGASGSAVTWRLAEKGFKVLCLEQGRWQQPENYPPAGPDWESRQLGDFHFDPNLRALPEDYPVNVANSEIDPLMFNAVGGSTIHWTAHTPRFHPSDFRVKTLDGVADDWPISYQDIEPYYDLNDGIMGCSGISGDPANPPRKARTMPPIPLGKDGERIARGFDKLGWHWWVSDSYINSVEFDGRLGCNNCGPVGLGCVPGAKASTDITYIPKAMALGAKVRDKCRVTKIITDESGRVSGVAYLDAKHNSRTVHANAVIVACNGIGTPRMLLISKSDQHPNGLANSSGLVGKNLMFHPYAMVSGFFPKDEDIRTWEGPMGNIILSQEFYETDSRKDYVRGYTYQIVRSTGPALTAAGTLMPPVPWGARHHEEFDKRFGNTTTITIISEDLPEEQNRVELDSQLTDSDGLPAPKIFYKTSENTRLLLADGVANAERVLKTAGATEVLSSPLFRSAGWHLMGTARMGEDPRHSVANAWGQTHDVDNLFVVDGSLFTTSAAVNPTPTIQALALRTADYIASNRQDLEGDHHE